MVGIIHSPSYFAHVSLELGNVSREDMSSSDKEGGGSVIARYTV